MRKALSVAACILLFVGHVFAEDVVVKVNLVSEEGIGKEIGTITASDSKFGLILTPQLSDLTSGLHGFHGSICHDQVLTSDTQEFINKVLLICHSPLSCKRNS